MGMAFKKTRHLVGRFWDNTSNEKLPYAEHELGHCFLVSICEYVFQYIIINIPHGYYIGIYIFEYIFHGDGFEKYPTFVRSILGQHIERETAIC